MTVSVILREIGRKGSNKDRIARTVLKDPRHVDELAEGLGAREARVKYGCARIFLILSEMRPFLVYPRIDLFLGLLESENNILRWTAIQVIANLALVDARAVIESHFEEFFFPIRGPALVTAANIIGAAPRIAIAKPHLAERITEELLKVQHARYRTAECRRVALGHTVKSLEAIYDLVVEKERVLKLVRAQTRSSRGGTKKAAERFLKKHHPQ
jgi:hypothetical protein